MDAQGVEVLHVTNGDTVVVTVTHHLIFYLLPALQRLLHQHLGRESEGLLGQLIQFFLVVTETRAQTTQCIGSTQDDRIAQVLCSLTCLFDGLASLALDGLHANLVEFLHEELAVLRVDDGLHRRTQHLDAILLEHAALIQFHATVQCRLTTKGQQDAVRTFLLDDTLHEVRLHRQEIYLVGHTLRGLHRGNVRINQHRFDALFLQGFQGLATTIVKFAGLTNLQGA